MIDQVRKAGTRGIPGYAIALLLLLAVPQQACKDKKPAATGAPVAAKPMTVDAMVVSEQSLMADIEVPGSLIANETTEIHPEMSGRLTQLNIQEGRTVSRGTLLAKLYDGDLQAQMRKLQVQLKIAEQTENRQAQLLKIQGISQQDYDLSLLQVQSLRADMEIVREGIRKTEIRAPFSGKLGLKNVSPGAYVTPATVLTSVSQLDKIKIQFSVPERYGSQLKNGMNVSFRVDGSPKEFTASILATESTVEESTRSMTARAIVKEKDVVLLPGAFAKVTIILGENEKALMVPNSVIIPSGRAKQIFTYEGGKAMMKEVVTGVRDSTNVEVISGIERGDTVITSAILFLRDKMDVTLGEVK
jgi:membrane fusion protein (multidrug efflux system)